MSIGTLQPRDDQEWADAKRDELYNLLSLIELTGERYLTLSTILSTFEHADATLNRPTETREGSRHSGLRLVSSSDH